MRTIVTTFYALPALLLFSSLAAANNNCLEYAPSTVQLTGLVESSVFPGPPNYESVEKGDKPETYWILHLDKPICVNADTVDKLNTSESDIKETQLIISTYDKYRHLLGQKVRAIGALSHALTGHHHTSVMLEVYDLFIENTKPEAQER